MSNFRGITPQSFKMATPFTSSEEKTRRQTQVKNACNFTSTTYLKKRGRWMLLRMTKKLIQRSISKRSQTTALKKHPWRKMSNWHWELIQKCTSNSPSVLETITLIHQRLCVTKNLSVTTTCSSKPISERNPSKRSKMITKRKMKTEKKLSKWKWLTRSHLNKFLTLNLRSSNSLLIKQRRA